MRTPRGAGVSHHRHLRDATSVKIHPLTFLLTVLLVLCPYTTAAQATGWNPQLLLESHVVVGADGIARTRGASRAHSDGLSITRSTPVENNIDSGDAVDDQAIRFTPARVDLGRVETCSPQVYNVGIENRGRVSVRLDGADFTQDGFSLANDVRGIRLDPGNRFNIQFVFLPSDVSPNGVDAHMRVLSTSGLFTLPIRGTEVMLNKYGVSAVRASIPAGVRFEQSLQFVNPFDSTIRLTELYALDNFINLEMKNGSKWIGPRWPRKSDDTVVKEVHGEYDQEFDYTRRANRNAWDMPAGMTSPFVKVTLESRTPGVYLTYIHIAAGTRRLLLIPVRITVLKPGIHIEPKELDLGVLTDLNEEQPFEAVFSLYNTGINPIEVLELKVLDSNLLVSAQLRGSAVIAPRTRARHALTVQLLVNSDEQNSECFASLLLKTNASSSELGQRKLRLYGKVLKGHLEFYLNETIVGATVPLVNVFDDVSTRNGAVRNNEPDIVESKGVDTPRLVSIVDGNGSNDILSGTSQFRKLRLWNRFDGPVELQRVWISDAGSKQDNHQEITVHKYKQAIVQAGAAWPKISLQVSPVLQALEGILAARSYSLMIETNATLHRIQMHLHHGFLSVESSRGLHSYSVSGYIIKSRTTSQKQTKKSSRTCLAVPMDGIVPANLRVDDRESTMGTRGVRLCRSLLFDLEKVASHRARIEVVEVANANPVPITLGITSIAESDVVNISITVSLVQGAARFASTGGPDTMNTSPKRELSHNITSVGNKYVIRPGYKVIFHVEVMATGRLGRFTVPVLSLETSTEVVHLYGRLRSVRGTIEPVTPAVMLPSMFPGRIEVVHLQYRNTFAHAVTPVMATLSSSKLKLLSMSDAMEPQRVESVLHLLFSPMADLKCSDALFLADCLLPSVATDTEETCEQLSNYGEYVGEYDLVALNRRDAFWNGGHGKDHKLRVEAQVHLQTDIIDDVAGVTIMALLERPMVTAIANIPAPSINDSFNAFERREFVLTEVLGLSHVFVDVRNPSNISIQMELASAEVDRDLFYTCEQEANLKSALGDDNNTATKLDNDILAICLPEWKSVATTAVANLRVRSDAIDVPPFYFERRVVRVLAGEEAKLGPIFYLPSQVEEVSTTIFVRNDLSHIEPVPLLARSGKGTLELEVDLSTSPTSFVTFNPRELTSDKLNGNIGDDEMLEYDGTLIFALSQDSASEDYNRSVEISLSNPGQFGLTIHGVTLESDSRELCTSSSWIADSTFATNDFFVRSKFLNVEVCNSERKSDRFDPVLLPPGKTVGLHVTFVASCYSAMAASWLKIDTSDGIKRLRLEGTISSDAAFSCLRARMSPTLRNAFHMAWILTVGVAVFSVLYTAWSLLCDAWNCYSISKAQYLCISTSTEDEQTVRGSSQVLRSLSADVKGRSVTTSHTIASIYHLLEDMERATSTPPSHVVTPAVAKLLEHRHKGMCPTVCAQNLFDDDDEVDENRHEPDRNVQEPASPNARMPNRKVTSFSNNVEKLQGYVVLPTGEIETNELIARKQGADSVATGEALQPDSVSVDGGEDPASDDDSNHSDDSSDIDAAKTNRDMVTSIASSNLHQDHLDSLLGPNLTAPAQLKASSQSEEPFDVFKSLSARWREQDWSESLIGPPQSAFGNFSDGEEWDSALSLRPSVSSTTRMDQRGEGRALSGGLNTSQHESEHLLGRPSPGFYLDGLPALESPLTTRAGTPTTKKAPPGFTTADAKPLEARAAFDRLRAGNNSDSNSSVLGSIPSTSGDGFGGSSLFASRLPLFGPALPPPSDGAAAQRVIGRIGSGRQRLLRADGPLESSTDENDSLAHLGGGLALAPRSPP